MAVGKNMGQKKMRRKKAEESLQDDITLLRALFENSPDQIMIIDSHYKIINVNKTFSNQYTPKTILGRDAVKILPSDKRKKVKFYFDLAFKTEKIYEFKHEIMEGIMVFIRVIPIRQGGKNEQLMVISTDITDQKFAEDRQNKYEQQMQQTQKLESLGILAGGIAHDFNNLLSIILCNVQMADEVSKNEQVTELLKIAEKTIFRASVLTRQLLTFSKGGVPLLKIEPLLPFLSDTVKFALSGSNVTAKYNIQPGLWNCNYDKNQIGQVIDNLVINAKQSMPKGGVLKISAANVVINKNRHSFLKEGKYVKISIADEGPGIPKEVLARIFEPFFTTKSKGTGLGLTICYSIIKRHNGYIEINSEPGKGAVADILLPAGKDVKISRDRSAIKIHQGSGMVLIMDDEPEIRRIMGKILYKLGYESIETQNSREAVSAFIKAKKEGSLLKAVFLDLTIPGESGGIETIKEIRKIDRSIPAFVVSGYSNDPAVADPQKFGFTASIQKPFEIAKLTDLLNKYLKSGS